MTATDKINHIEDKINQLGGKLRELQQENINLTAENKKLKATFSKSEEMVVDLKNKLEKTQHALEQKQADDPEHSVKLRKQLDKYIEEIDKCIEWLENR